MQQTEERNNLPLSAWLLIMACVVVVTFALCGGAAYAGVRQARQAAAKASVGQIETVLFLAEGAAEDAGLGPPPASYATLLKSYDDAGSATLPAYEKYVLDRMLESFGPGRDFDFAVTRTEDGTGNHTQVYYFPTRGRTDLRSDHYYLLSGGSLSEANG